MDEKIQKVRCGGKIEGSGRKRGVPNKKTAELQAAVAASGMMPLEYMLNVMRDTDADPSRRDEMAKAAGPYLHPKLANIQHSGVDGKDLIPPSDPVDIARRVAFLLASAINK